MAETQQPTTVEVANPDHVALTALRAAVLDARDSLARALDAPTEQMHAGTAWTGPGAGVAWPSAGTVANARPATAAIRAIR